MATDRRDAASVTPAMFVPVADGARALIVIVPAPLPSPTRSLVQHDSREELRCDVQADDHDLYRKSNWGPVPAALSWPSLKGGHAVKRKKESKEKPHLQTHRKDTAMDERVAAARRVYETQSAVKSKKREKIHRMRSPPSLVALDPLDRMKDQQQCMAQQHIHLTKAVATRIDIASRALPLEFLLAQENRREFAERVVLLSMCRVLRAQYARVVRAAWRMWKKRTLTLRILKDEAQKRFLLRQTSLAHACAIVQRHLLQRSRMMLLRWRDSTATLRWLEQMLCARRIQKCWRVWRLQKKLKTLALLYQERLRNESAMCIQSAIRRFLAHCEMARVVLEHRQVVAAGRIKNAYRNYVVLKIAKHLRQESAATHIQRMWRGRLGRQLVQRRHGMCRSAVVWLVEKSWMPVAVGSAIAKHACATQVQRMCRAYMFQRQVNSGVRRSYKRRHHFPAYCIQHAWSGYRLYCIRVVVESVVFRVVVTHMASARRIQQCFRTYWQAKITAAASMLTRLFRRFSGRRQIVGSFIVPWILQWQSIHLCRWCTACGGGGNESRWRQSLSSVRDSILQFQEDQLSQLRRLQLGLGIRLLRQLKQFEHMFLTARARQIQRAWRWHRLRTLVSQLRVAVVVLRRAIPTLYRQHERRQRRQRVLQRWKRQRFMELHSRFDTWKLQYLVKIQARDLATTTRNVRKALWFHHHKLRQSMVRRWTEYVNHRRHRHRQINHANMHANLSLVKNVWRAWKDEALPKLCCANRLREVAMTLTVWKTWNAFVTRKQLSRMARTHRQHCLTKTAFSEWKQDRLDFAHELDVAYSYLCYHTKKRAFLQLARFTAKAKQVCAFSKMKLQLYGLRHWLESVDYAKRARANRSAASMFRQRSLARSSWRQWTRYCCHQSLQKEKRRAMAVYYEKRRVQHVVSAWRLELVPMWKDYNLILSVAAAYRAMRLKERYFCQGIRVFWDLTVGARRVAMATRIQRMFRGKRARKRIVHMRLKIQYQFETRTTMATDTQVFTTSTLQVAIQSHEWVFVLFSVPWAPVQPSVTEAFSKTATAWSLMRDQGRRMVFGMADATAIISFPLHSFSLMSWFGLQPDHIPCIVGFWQGVGPSSSAKDLGCRLSTGEVRQLKRRFMKMCDVPAGSPYTLVYPVTTKKRGDSLQPVLTMSRLVGWIERLQYASREATAVDLQSYLRGFLARRHTKRYRILHTERRKQYVRAWCTKLLSSWTNKKRHNAAVVLQVWIRRGQTRRRFWIAFRHEILIGKQVTQRIQRAARVYLNRLRLRRALVSLTATPQRYPNAPLCQACVVNSEALARLHCQDCMQVYCADCFAKAHNSGKRLLHLCDSIDFVAFNEASSSMCKSCDVRRATRVCWTCGPDAVFCTSCFEVKHTDEPSDGTREDKHKGRSRSVWWSSAAFRDHNWKKTDSTSEVSAAQWHDVAPLTASGVMDKYVWESKATVLRKQRQAALAEESLRDREDKLLAIRVQQEAILRDAFDRYDADKSGAIDRHEFKRMFKEELCEPLSDELVDEAMTRMDKSENGLVEFDELLAWFAEEVLAKEESGTNQQVDPRSLSMLKDALRAKRQMRRYKEKLNEFVPTVSVRVPKPQALTKALSRRIEQKPKKRETVPGFPSVACLEHTDFAHKRKVFYRFVKEICGLDWIYEDEATIPIVNAMEVFDQTFVPRWNAGDLTYDFYFDEESFEYEGEAWQRKWVADTGKYIFTTTRRKMRKVEVIADHTMSPKRRRRSSLLKNSGHAKHEPAGVTEIEETVEIVEHVDPRRKQMLLEEAQAAFQKADSDKSGFIDEREFHCMLTSELCEPVSKTNAKQIMKQLDVDGSGKIDFHEFFQWYAVEKCQDYPVTPQMARARALLQTKRRAKATAAAAVQASVTGGRQVKDAVARKRADQQLAHDCKGASPELIELLQEGFAKPLAEKALTLHNHDVAFARKWLRDRQDQEQRERDVVAQARADKQAHANAIASEKKQKRRQRMDAMRKRVKLLAIGPNKKEAHTARMEQALSNLERELQLVTQ